MADIKLIIDYDNGNIKSVTAEAEKDFAKSGEKAGKEFSSNFRSALNSVGRQVAKIGAAVAAIGGVALFKSIKNAASLEVINTQFEVMLKSAEAAQKQVEDLQKFAASTPFQLPGLAEATKQLLSFGVLQDNIIPTLQQLGDVAAGVGADITDLTIPYGRLISTQKLTLQELDKFADRGVNIYAELSKETGRSLRTIRDEISKGNIPFEAFINSLNNLTGESGLFFQGMAKQSKTLSGVISTLQDNFFNLSANIGKAFTPEIVAGAEKIIAAIQNLSKTLIENEELVKGGVNFISDYVSTYANLAAEMVKAETPLTAINQKILEQSDLIDNVKKVRDEFASTQGDFFGASPEMLAQQNEALKAQEQVLFDLVQKRNEIVRTGMQEQRAILAAEGAATQEMQAQQQANSVESTQTFAQLTIDTFAAVGIASRKTKDEMAKVAQQTANIVKGGLVKSISGGIQNITNSLLKGEDVFANFGKFILGTFGDLAIQLGTFFIAQGIAIEALNAVSGTGAIAAGAALVALGTILKSFSGSGGASSASGASGGSAGSTAFEASEPAASVAGEDLEPEQARTILNVQVDGNVVDNGSFYRDLAEGISDESGKSGIVFDNFRTV